MNSLPPFNLASSWPPTLRHRLLEERALTSAREADAWTLVKDLRNALAHGNITYLDNHGQHLERGFRTGMAATHFGFVAVTYGSINEKQDERSDARKMDLRVWRVSHAGFRMFLRNWAGWLATGTVGRALAEVA